MIRTMSTAVASALCAKIVRLAFLIDIVFADNTYHFWTGAGVLSVNGVQYVGAAGALGQIDGLAETNQLQAVGVTLTLSGLDPTWINESMNEINRAGRCKISLAPIDAAGNVLTPVVAYSGFVDQPQISMGPESATIQLALETRLALMGRSRGGRYTDADQHARGYASDNALKFISAMQDRNVIWK